MNSSSKEIVGKQFQLHQFLCGTVSLYGIWNYGLLVEDANTVFISKICFQVLTDHLAQEEGLDFYNSRFSELLILHLSRKMVVQKQCLYLKYDSQFKFLSSFLLY